MNGSIARRLLVQQARDGLKALECPRCHQVATIASHDNAHCDRCHYTFVWQAGEVAPTAIAPATDAPEPAYIPGVRGLNTATVDASLKAALPDALLDAIRDAE